MVLPAIHKIDRQNIDRGITIYIQYLQSGYGQYGIHTSPFKVSEQRQESSLLWSVFQTSIVQCAIIVLIIKALKAGSFEKNEGLKLLRSGMTGAPLNSPQPTKPRLDGSDATNSSASSKCGPVFIFPTTGIKGNLLCYLQHECQHLKTSRLALCSPSPPTPPPSKRTHTHCQGGLGERGRETDRQDRETLLKRMEEKQFKGGKKNELQHFVNISRFYTQPKRDQRCSNNSNVSA